MKEAGMMTNYPVTPVRLSKNDLELIDYLIKRGEFKNRSEFIRFAIKLTLIKFIEKIASESFMNNSNSPVTQEDIEYFKKVAKEFESLIMRK